MKKYLIFFSVLSLLFIVSCENEISQTKISPTVELLAKSENFKRINQLIIDNLKNTKNIDNLKKIISKKTRSNQDNQEILRNLGFKNETDFINFQEELMLANDKLANEFDFSNLNENDKKQLVYSSLRLDPPAEPVYEDGSIGDDSSLCGQQYNACKQSAYGTYLMSVTACVAGGIGIGVGSAGWAAPVGGTLAGACCAGAQIQYEGSLNQCYYSYLLCKKENK